MRLIDCHMVNMRAHRETRIEFPERGIIGLVGDNESGKSTILESLTWALFGSATLRGKLSDLRWRGAAPRQTARVTWRLVIDGKQYTITRGETDARVSVLRDGAEQEVASGQSTVTEYMGKVIGMSHAEFAASYLCEQKEVTRLLVMRPMERQKFVRGVMGVDVLDDAVAAARKAKNELNQELAGFRAAMGTGEGLTEERDAARDTLTRAKSDLARADTRVAEATGRHEAQQGLLATSRKKMEMFESLDRTSNEVAERLRACNDRIVLLEDRIDELKEAKRELARVYEDIDDLSDIDSKVKGHEASARVERRRERWSEELRVARLEAQDLQAEIDDAQKLYRPLHHGEPAAAEEAVDSAEIKYSHLRDARLSSLHRAESASSNAHAHIKRLNEAIGDGDCPTCGRELENLEALRAEIDDARSRYAEHNSLVQSFSKPSTEEVEAGNDILKAKAGEKELAEQRRRAVTIGERLEGLRKRLARANKQAGELVCKLGGAESVPPYHPADHEHDLRLQRQYVACRARQRDLEQQARKLPETRTVLDGLLTEKEGHEKQQAHLAEELVGIGFSYDEHAELERAYDEAKATMDARVTERQDLAWQVRDKQHQYQAAAVALAEFQKKQEQERDMANRLAVETSVADRLNTFRAAVLGSIRPEVEELMSGFVDLLSDGRHETASLDDTFGVLLHEDGLESPVISGGTEDITALALRLAISQMIAERTGATLNTIILDEPFGSLDATRRANVLALLRRLGGIFSQVILISHIAETREAVDRVVELSYDESKGHTRVLS